MRKSLFMAIVAIAAVTACNQPADNSANDKAQKNIEAGRVVTHAFETGDPSGIDSVVAADFVDHTDRGDMGRDSLKAFVTQMHEHSKDAKVETLSETADGDYLFQWLRYTGTSDGYMGMPAGAYDMKMIEVSKLKDGKFVEHWGYMDVAEMAKMMGGAPPMDPTKMK